MVAETGRTPRLRPPPARQRQGGPRAGLGGPASLATRTTTNGLTMPAGPLPWQADEPAITVPRMTTTEEADPYRPSSQVAIAVLEALSGGNAIIVVEWSSQSPWVPNGELRLRSTDAKLADMTPSVIVEAILKQLRLSLQAMVSEVWPAF